MAERGHILVADDEPTFRTMLATRLRRQGYRCDEVDSADGVRTCLATHPVEVLICDINMPGNDDLQLVRALSDLEDGPAVILITGAPSVPTAAAAVGLRVEAYLIKPFDSAELDRLLVAAVQSARHRRCLARQLAQMAGWQDSLRAIRWALDRPGAGALAAQQLQVSLTVEQILAGVLDLQALGLDVPAGDEASPAETLAPGTQQLLAALHDTVEVLERTKRAFKSKELGQLRERIELLLRTT